MMRDHHHHSLLPPPPPLTVDEERRCLILRAFLDHFLPTIDNVWFNAHLIAKNGGTNLGHLFHFVADQFSVAGALPPAQHI
ncbi:hypothetical protein LXL04_037159 [Taraxacum kok-saghyz]